MSGWSRSGPVGLSARATVRGRLLGLVGIAVLIGTAGATVHAAASASSRARSSFDRFSAGLPQPNIDVQLTLPGDQDLVRTIGALPGVRGVSLGSFVAVLPKERGI